MPWLLTGHGSLCLEEHYHQAYWWMKLSLFTSSTQVCTFFVISFGWPPRSKTQNSSIPRNPTPTMAILVRRPPNLRGNHLRVLCPRDNHKRGQPLRRMPTQYMVLPLFKELPPRNWASPPPRRLLVSETPVQMTYHHNPRVRMISQDISRRTTTIAEVRGGTMRSSWCPVFLLRKKFHGWRMSVSLSLNESCRQCRLRKPSGTSALHS